MSPSQLSLCVLLAMLCGAAHASPWNVGDIFATAYGRLHVIDGKTLKPKQTVNLFARNGVAVCKGKIAGGAFDKKGTVLYLACEDKNKIVSLDATSVRHHRVLGNFSTAAMPNGIAVDKAGTLYVSHSEGEPGAVSWYTSDGEFLGQIQTAGKALITGLTLSADEDKLLTATGSPDVHQYSITEMRPLDSAVGATLDLKRGSKCYGLDVPKDGSVLIACKSCVYHLGPNGAPTGKKFCPAGNHTSLKHVALDASNQAFYVADASGNSVTRVSLQTWNATVKFSVPGAQKVHGLVVLKHIDQAAFDEGRRKSEEEWQRTTLGRSTPSKPKTLPAPTKPADKPEDKASTKKPAALVNKPSMIPQTPTKAQAAAQRAAASSQPQTTKLAAVTKATRSFLRKLAFN